MTTYASDIEEANDHSVRKARVNSLDRYQQGVIGWL
jgi:hypothetical protein